ncbi:hypothetical protein [Vibrio phage pTD1]|uniref:Big-1 domain-containing protein n=1 Tax=Vibrio phage pTD1 TaxID=1938577 RepID=A0A1Q2U334_9CAUD|nr:hypothetical protein FDH33_gp159 [Vibrio phage pTD1]BAW98368.1 hypothetical protein [Vibrio phage pTD1]
MAEVIKGTGPRKMTMKRSDGKPDVDIVSNADGKWSVDVGSEGKGKVTFQFFNGEEKLGEQVIDFVSTLDGYAFYDKLSTKNYSNVIARLISDSLAPVPNTTVSFSYSVDGEAAVTGSSYPSNQYGLFSVSIPTNEMVGKSKLALTLTLGEVSATLNFDLVDEYLPMNFDTVYYPQKADPDEVLKVYGKTFYSYSETQLLGPNRKLVYVDRNPALPTDVSASLEDNGFFAIDIPPTQMFALMNNASTSINAPDLIKGVKRPDLLRVGSRNLMIFDTTWSGGSSVEFSARLFDQEGTYPVLNSSSMTVVDLRATRYYQTANLNNDGSMETWLSVRDDSKHNQCFVDGRLVHPQMTRYGHTGNMFNLAAGTSNWVRIGQPVVNVFAFTNALSIPTAGVSVKLSSIENGVKTEVGTAVTDKYGVVSFTIEPRDQQTRLEMVAEADGLELYFVNDWVDASKYKVATDITLPFIPPIFYDGYIQLNFDPIDANGERFNTNPTITYEGMHLQVRDYPFYRPYLDLGEGESRYMFSLGGELEKFPNRTRIAMSCDEMRVDKDVVIGKAKGINPLIYAAGAGVAGYPITVGWRVLDDALAPLANKTVKVWYDAVEGEAVHTLTTDAFGSVTADVPWKPLTYKRTIIIQSEGDEFTQELMWTRKSTACDISLHFSETQLPGTEWSVDVKAKDQFGKLLTNEACALYEVWMENKAGIYNKEAHNLNGRYTNRSGKMDLNWPTDDTQVTNWVYYTETGFKEFVFDKNNLTNTVSAPVTALKVQPWSPVYGNVNSTSKFAILATDAEGSPVANAVIEVHKTDAAGELYATVMTNDKGEAYYETNHVKVEGNETLYFVSNGISTTYVVEWTTSKTGAVFEDMDWTLDVANGHDGILVGRVKSHLGEFVHNSNLRFYDAVTGTELSGMGSRTFMDGRFTAPVPGTGIKDYVVATDDGFFPFRMVWSDIPLINPTHFELASTTSKVFVMDNDMLVSGSLVDADGGPVRLTGVPELVTQTNNQGYTNNPLLTPDGEFEVFEYPDKVGDINIKWKLNDTLVHTMTFPVISGAYLEITPMSIDGPYYQTPAELVALVTDEDSNPVEGAFVALTGDSVTGTVGGLTNADGLVRVKTPYPSEDAASLDFSMSYCGGIMESRTVTWVSRNFTPASEITNISLTNKCSEGEAFSTLVTLGMNNRPANTASTLQLYDFGTKTYTDLTASIVNNSTVEFSIPVHATGVHKFALCGSGAYLEFDVEWIVGVYDPIDGMRAHTDGDNAEVGGTGTVTGVLTKEGVRYSTTKVEPLFARRKSDGKVFEGTSDVGGSFSITVEISAKGENRFEIYRRPELILGETWMTGMAIGSIEVGPDANKLMPLGEYPYLPVYVKDTDGKGVPNAEVNVYLKGGDGTSLASDVTDEAGYIDLWPAGRDDEGDLTYVVKFGSKEAEHTMTFTSDTNIPYSLYVYSPRYWKTGEAFRVGGFILNYDNAPIANVTLGGIWLASGATFDFTADVDENGRFEFEVPASTYESGGDTLSIYTTSGYSSSWVTFSENRMTPHHIVWDAPFPTSFVAGQSFTVSGKVVDKDGVTVPISQRLYARFGRSTTKYQNTSDGTFSITLTPPAAGNEVLTFYFNDYGYVGRQIIDIAAS